MHPAVWMLVLAGTWSSVVAGRQYESPLCRTGRLQSPINIRASRVERRPYKKFVFRGITNLSDILLYRYNNNSVVGILAQQMIIDEGPLVTAYNLHSFRVLSFSDHMIYSNLFPFELQFYFIRNYLRTNMSFTDQELISAAHSKSMVVMSVMLDISDREPEMRLMRLFAYEMARIEMNHTHQMHLQMRVLVPHVTGYFTYVGSLVHGPCTEGVLWIVVEEPQIISPTQAGQFSQAFHHRFRRPIQRIDKIKVLYYPFPSSDLVDTPLAHLVTVLVALLFLYHYVVSVS